MGRTVKDRPNAPTAAERAGSTYLAASVLGALNTSNARKPLRATGAGGLLGFFPGWLTSELPLHTIAWQALASGFFAGRGSLRTWRGRLGLLISAGSWYSLVKIWKQSMVADQVFDAAVRLGIANATTQLAQGHS